MKFSNFSIGSRLGIGFFSVLVLMMALTITGLISMGDIHDRLNTIVEDNVDKMNLLQDMSESVHVVSKTMGTLVLAQEKSDIQKELQGILEARKKYDTALMTLEKKSKSFSDKALREKVIATQRDARTTNNRVIDLAQENHDEEASNLLIGKAAPLNQAWQDALDESIALQKKANTADAIAADTTYEKARLTMIVMSIGALLLGIAVAIAITRSIARPIRTAMLVAQTVASGDLTSKIEVTSTDETGKLLGALKEMNGNLVRIVSQARTGTETIATASNQIASGNLDLSSRTEEQAASLEETASSMEQLTSTVKQNADNARQANQLAVAASTTASRGVEVVNEVVATMVFIQTSAQKIADIIAVIDGIAFQTNILALNAAVEAARAGEQGRGFAVVASEVRNLAQRSAVAAKDIRILIADSVDKVETGSKLVNEAGKTMGEIARSAKQVTDIMSDIAAASEEQSAGIHQINQAVAQMDQVTQQNAALVEEAAAAAESLKEQAIALANVVSVFRLTRTHLVHTPASMVEQNVFPKALALPA